MSLLARLQVDIRPAWDDRFYVVEVDRGVVCGLFLKNRIEDSVRWIGAEACGGCQISRK